MKKIDRLEEANRILQLVGSKKEGVFLTKDEKELLYKLVKPRSIMVDNKMYRLNCSETTKGYLVKLIRF